MWDFMMLLMKFIIFILTGLATCWINYLVLSWCLTCRLLRGAKNSKKFISWSINTAVLCVRFTGQVRRLLNLIVWVFVALWRPQSFFILTHIVSGLDCGMILDVSTKVLSALLVFKSILYWAFSFCS